MAVQRTGAGAPGSVDSPDLGVVVLEVFAGAVAVVRREAGGAVLTTLPLVGTL